MLCSKPYFQGLQPYPCGQCMCCLFNKRRLWASRIMLESLMHEQSVFCTLTYSDEYLPPGGTLVPRHVQLYLKRLRLIRPVRFFASGEYGEENGRPHYHLALFGQPLCLNGRTVHRRNPDFRCCSNCEEMRRTWGMGGIDLAELTPESAGYIAGYIAQKLTSTRHDHKNWLQGRHPEFGRMSRRPGLGAAAVPEIARVVLRQAQTVIEKTGDVPQSLLIAGGKSVPIGRYLRRLIREEVGFEQKASFPWRTKVAGVGAPELAQKLRAAEMLNLLADSGYAGFRQAVVETTRIQSLENRMKIRRVKKL